MDLTKMTLAQLKEVAKEKGMKGVSTLKKQELMERIQALDHSVSIDMETIARTVASPRAANIVLLGAASPFLGIEVGKIEESIRTIFARKGEAVVEMNQKAFRAGLEVAEQSIKR